MLCSRKVSNKIKKVYDRSLRLVNNDYESKYEKLLSKYNSFSIRDQNINRLAAKIYKTSNDLSVRDFKHLFSFKDQYASHNPLVETPVGILAQ